MSVTVITNMYPDDDAPYLGTFVKDTIGFFGKDDDVVYPGNSRREKKLSFYWAIYKSAMSRIASSQTIVIHYPLFFLPLVVFSRLLRKKIVLVYHGGEFMDRPGRRANLRWFRQLIFRANNHVASQILVPSKFVADRYFLSWESKVRVWYSGGIQTGRLYTEPDRRKYDFAYFGRMDYEKGYDCYIAALRELSGQTGQHTELKCLSVCRENRELRTEDCDNISILHSPPILHAEVLEKLVHSEFVVIPSRNESLCLLALEAANSGAIVIARRLPAIQEALGEFAIYFDKDSELPRTLKQALSMPEESRHSMVLKQRERVKRFDRDTLQREYQLEH